MLARFTYLVPAPRAGDLGERMKLVFAIVLNDTSLGIDATALQKRGSVNVDARAVVLPVTLY